MIYGAQNAFLLEMVWHECICATKLICFKRWQSRFYLENPLEFQTHIFRGIYTLLESGRRRYESISTKKAFHEISAW